MNIKTILSCLFCFQIAHPVVFNGLIESGISKNNFLCPSISTGTIPCTAADANAKGFNVTNNSMLQLFNNQAFWLNQEAEEKQYVSQVLNYSGADLQNKMIANGWGAMGSYCIILSTDPILTSIIMPNLIAGENQEKIVVQLWYNENEMLQLWSQDAAILSTNQQFTVLITTATDPLPGVMTTPTNTPHSLRDSFLKNLHLQQNNRAESVYQIATQSPRSVKIQGAIAADNQKG